MPRRAALCLLLALGLLPAAPAQAHHVEFRVLRSGSFIQLTGARQGRPFLLVLWSVSCEPCRQQFPMLAELRRAHPGMPLVLVSTDGTPLQRTAGEALMQAGLEHESNWIFARRLSPALLQEIDAGWDGSLPRSYWYDGSHRREVVAGTLDRARIEGWLAREAGDQ